MGANNSKASSETINWKNVHTNSMSSTLPNMNTISHDAKQLVARLQVPVLSESDENSNMVGNIFSGLHGGNTHNTHNNNINNDSPFISSEMYNYLVNKYQHTNMVGGADEMDDEDETSSTSSSPASSPSSSPMKKEKKEKKPMKKVSPVEETEETEEVEESPEEVEETVESPEEQTNGRKKNRKMKKGSKKQSYKGNRSDAYLSYISSSAHTNGSASLLNENNYSISSVNTSDINMLSEI